MQQAARPAAHPDIERAIELLGQARRAAGSRPSAGTAARPPARSSMTAPRCTWPRNSQNGRSENMNPRQQRQRAEHHARYRRPMPKNTRNRPTSIMISPIGSAAAPWLAAKMARPSMTSRKTMAITVARPFHRRFGRAPGRPPPALPASLPDIRGDRAACRSRRRRPPAAGRRPPAAGQRQTPRAS